VIVQLKFLFGSTRLPPPIPRATGTSIYDPPLSWTNWTIRSPSILSKTYNKLAHPILPAVFPWTLCAMASASVKTGHFLAKVLGIKLNNAPDSDSLTRGESVFSVQSANSYIEREPTSGEWVRDRIPGPHDVVAYARSLFPFTYWIGRYNLQWFLGDMVAGNSPCLFVFWNELLTRTQRHHDWRCCGAARDGLCRAG
jgi:hypothetical protein